MERQYTRLDESRALIDGIIKALRSYHDESLHGEARGDTKLMRRLVAQYFYCG